MYCDIQFFNVVAKSFNLSLIIIVSKFLVYFLASFWEDQS